MENRLRFLNEVVEAVVGEIGADRTGVRISPFTNYMESEEEDPTAYGVAVVKSLNNFNLLYVHCIEPRLTMAGETPSIAADNLLWPVRKAYTGNFICAGGFNRDEANDAIRTGRADLVAFGRYFLANPDLPKRLALNAPLHKYNRATFYTQDPVIGYTDYPFFNDCEAPASSSKEN